jgi:hypothetical protein
VVGVCGQCIRTADGFDPGLLDAVGPLDVRGICVCVGLESSKKVAHGSGSSVGCFPLDTGGVGTYLASGEDCLEI